MLPRKTNNYLKRNSIYSEDKNFQNIINFKEKEHQKYDKYGPINSRNWLIKLER
jgi:hypothetical protein